jgi:hypothetical protein
MYYQRIQVLKRTVYMSWRRWNVQETALWLGLLAGLVLPALFHVGYRIFDLEVWVTLLVLLVLGQLAALLPKLVAASVAALCLALTVHVHYLPGLTLWSGAGVVAACLALAGFASRGMLAAGASAGTAAAMFAALSGTSLWTTLGDHPSEVGQGPAVIHIVLDEQAAPGGLPAEVVPPHEIKEASDWFVERGFTTFQRSYSDHRLTVAAISMIANADQPMLDPKTAARESPPGSGNWDLTSASAFAAVAAKRPIRAVTSTYFDMRPTLDWLQRATRSAAYNPGAPSPTLSVLGAALGDRLTVMRALTVAWLANRQKIELLLHFARKNLAIRTFVSEDVTWRLQPAASMLVMNRLIDVEVPRLKRGQYLFAHVLLPHYPYVFERNCQLRPVSAWRNRIVSSGAMGTAQDTLQSRAERYQLYVEQAACTRVKLGRLLEAVETNPALRDAVVVLHGDHGTRIAIEDRAALADSGYTEAHYLRDWHAAFFAVRLPARNGQLVTEPNAVHDLFASLIANDFTSLPTTGIARSPLAARIYPQP